MPNRIIRSELLDSEAWLALKGNEDRCAYLAVLLTADNFGDLPAGPHRLVRLWRPFGIDSPEKASKSLNDLADADLVRLYTVDDKRYLHIPRFGQRMRYTRHAWPLSPWATTEEKQLAIKISPASSSDSPQLAATIGKEVEVEVEVEVEKNKTGVGGLVVPPLSRATHPEGPPEPLPLMLKRAIGKITRPPSPPKTVEQKEADRARQLDFVAKMTREPKS